MDFGRIEAPGISSGSWPGLSRPPRSFWLYALKFGVAGASPATTCRC